MDYMSKLRIAELEQRIDASPSNKKGDWLQICVQLHYEKFVLR